jgi:hypothetical protein
MSHERASNLGDEITHYVPIEILVDQAALLIQLSQIAFEHGELAQAEALYERANVLSQAGSIVDPNTTPNN